MKVLDYRGVPRYYGVILADETSRRFKLAQIWTNFRVKFKY